MSDVLIYWRDYRQNWIRQFAPGRAYQWHSSARVLGELQTGDRLWFITSGKILRLDPEQAGFLVAVWEVQQVMENPDDDPAYPKDEYSYRIVAGEAEFGRFNPVLVDCILRPAGRDKAVSIGYFLQRPRKLKDETVRLRVRLCFVQAHAPEVLKLLEAG